MDDQPRSAAIVLGSGSFGGGWFVRRALDRGHRVIGVNRSAEKGPAFHAYADHPRRSKLFRFHQIDINKDLPALLALIRDEEPEIVADFAGQGMVAPSWKWPEQWYQTNIVAKVQLHNALKDLASLRAYIRVSTPEVFGANTDLLAEDTPMNPSTPYAVSHAAIDMSLAAFHRQYGLPVYFTRFANFYGPFQQLYRIIPRALLSALSGKKLPLHGGGHSSRAFIHGADVADGMFAAIEHGKAGRSYHFATDEILKIRTLVKLIADKIDRPFADLVEITDDRTGKDAIYRMDWSRAREELGWSPKYSLANGLDETHAWVRSHYDVLAQSSWEYVHEV